MKRKREIIVLTFIAAVMVGGGAVQADFVFGTPLNLGPTVNSSDHDDTPSISADGLELYFMSYRLLGKPDGDLYVSTRITTQDPWGVSVNLGPTVNTSFYDIAPCISSDGLELYFFTNRPEAYEGGAIWVTKRATRNDDWGPPVPLGRFFSGVVYAYTPAISSDGLELYISEYYVSGVGNDQRDLWVISRSSVSDPWGQPMNLGPTVNSPASDSLPSISSDGRMLFFNSDRSGGLGDMDIWVTRRASPDDDWGAPVNLGPKVNTPGYEIGPCISADGRTLYFQSGVNRGYTNQEIWQVSINPVVDLNSDGIVDCLDIHIMIDNWGTDEPLCDIGPMPWGDGIVDVQDLIVLAEHLGKEFLPISLIENFDSLAVGTNMHDVNGWEGWQGDAQWGARVTDAVSYSGTNSLEIVGTRDDLVPNWPAVNSGAYVLTVMQYVPAATGGQMHFWVYWTGTLLSNCDTGKVYVDELDSATRVEADLLRDQWVELKIVMNLDINSCDFYYGDVLLGTRECFSSSRVNIWPDDNVDVVYYDDFRFEPAE